jgi:RHS repeat-associated protein
MSRATNYAFDLNGNVLVKLLDNGGKEVRTYDARNRVSTLENKAADGSTISKYAYQYDRVGNVMEVAETYPPGSLPNRTITNTYDGTYRLTNEKIVTAGVGTVETAYTYDKGNNRVAKVVSGGSDAGTTSYEIGNGSNGAGANQIKSATLPDSSVVSYAYDANGNRTQKVAGGHTDLYSYDYENRLVGLVFATGGSGTGVYAYQYDYRTRRVVRTELGAVTLVVFSGGVSIEEFGSAGPASPIVEYIRGHDYGGGVGGLEYSVRSALARFNQYDSRGDVTGQTDALGALLYQAAYEAFGKHPVESGSTLDRQKANTKEEDPTGLLNEGFRYRDLETGTFITRDPVGFKAGPNLYTYVSQNPWTHFDPEGLEAKVVVHLDPPTGPKQRPSDTPGKAYIFERSAPGQPWHYLGSTEVNKNGYMQKGDKLGNTTLAHDTHGIPASESGTSYKILPKNNYEGKPWEYPQGQPSITAPKYADPKSKEYNPGRAAEDYPNGTVRWHNKSSNETRDSTGCQTSAPTGVSMVKEVMDNNKNSGGTTEVKYTTPQTIKGPDGKQHEIRKAEPVGGEQPAQPPQPAQPAQPVQSARQQRVSQH